MRVLTGEHDHVEIWSAMIHLYNNDYDVEWLIATRPSANGRNSYPVITHVPSKIPAIAYGGVDICVLFEFEVNTKVGRLIGAF